MEKVYSIYKSGSGSYLEQITNLVKERKSFKLNTTQLESKLVKEAEKVALENGYKKEYKKEYMETICFKGFIEYYLYTI